MRSRPYRIKKRPAPPPEPCRTYLPAPCAVHIAHEHYRCLFARLAVRGLPCGAYGPFTLADVEIPCGEEIRIRIYGCTCRAQEAELLIPLTVWVQDGCGRTYRGASEVCVRVLLPQDCIPASLSAQACVRLAARGRPCCGPVLDALLDVVADVFAAPCAPTPPPLPPWQPAPPRPQPRMPFPREHW